MFHIRLLVALLVVVGVLHPWQGALANPPNIVFVLTDDLDVEYPANSWNKYTLLQNAMSRRGTTFINHYVTLPLCCPSRLSILRGQYAHNHGVFTNEPPEGGFPRAHNLGLEGSTIATWLQSAGYRTAYMGKYLNAYPSDSPGATYVPPGWSEWYVGPSGKYNQFNYTLNENGNLIDYGSTATDYLQDVLSNKALDFIRRNAERPNRQPFFLFISTYAPHTPAAYAARHETKFLNAIAPRGRTFNQADVSGLAAWVQTNPLLAAADVAVIDELYRDRLRSMLAVVETVHKIVNVLARTDDLDNTYIFFTSDNGFHLGQHRLQPGKNTGFEEDLRVPLIIRGPGVTAGRVLPHMTVNIDFAPTFAELAGIAIPESVDGRSLVPLLGSPPTPVSAWRKAFLVEHGKSGRSHMASGNSHSVTSADALEPQHDVAAAEEQASQPAFDGVHTKRYFYVEYLASGEPELYDLTSDPYQSRNTVFSAPPGLLSKLARWLDRLRTCQGRSCRTAEDSPPQ